MATTGSGGLRIESIGGGLRLVGVADLGTRAVLDRALAGVPATADLHLELAQLAFIDVGGVTALVAAAGRLDAGRRLVLHDPPPELLRIIDVMWGRPRTIEVHS
ncbi:STAS domain-containing protein [Catenuloplanes japonicus]|uniref:STAS domain-containing protein n=1 Tax=Catenuloplanes japonicus TaxID=33876 RepID=UPI00068C56ED|nr:STAS domain-containing protein [Catenuloplanes japonicus]